MPRDMFRQHPAAPAREQAQHRAHDRRHDQAGLRVPALLEQLPVSH